MTKDFSFARFFHPEKSPHPTYPDQPKHPKRQGRIVWDSIRKGPYVKARDGKLK